MLNPENAQNLEEELQLEQKKINDNRLGLIETLRNLKPPELTKTAAYNWNETIKEQCKLIENLNNEYIKKLRNNFEQVIQAMMDEIDNKIVISFKEYC